MMTQRRTIILVVSTAIIAVLVVLLVVHPWVKQPPAKQYEAGDTITYSDAVTSGTNSDLPGESGIQTSEVILAPGASINGLDALKAYVTGAQYMSVSDALTKFLLAHSGSSAVSAGIRQGSIAQSNNVLTFVLVAERPQAEYRVAIDISDIQRPSLTLERAG